MLLFVGFCPNSQIPFKKLFTVVRPTFVLKLRELLADFPPIPLQMVLFQPLFMDFFRLHIIFYCLPPGKTEESGQAQSPVLENPHNNLT